MTIFDDGPAKGRHFMLKRAPLFLRVTREGDRWDALDQLADEPRPGETIHAYRRFEGRPGMIHINASHGQGGFFTVCRYVHLPQQPTDADMRTNAAWRAWCQEHQPAKA